MNSYSRAFFIAAGATLLSYVIGCVSAREPYDPRKNPLIDDTKNIKRYDVKKNSEGIYEVTVKPITSEKPVFSEEDDSTSGSGDDPKDKNVSVITESKTRKGKTKFLTDLVLAAELGPKFNEVRTTARGLILPGKNLEINLDATGIAGVKSYEKGKDLAYQQFSTGVRARKGMNIDIGSAINGGQLFAELGAYLEGKQFTGRADSHDYNLLFRVGLGLFSKKFGTNIKAVFGAGPGNFQINFDDEQKQRLGLISNVVDESLTRIIADLQVHQTIWKAIYGKGRFAYSSHIRKDWDDYRAIVAELGAGLETKIEHDVFKRFYAELLATYRDEKDEYFNGASLSRNIAGIKAKVGFQLWKSMVVELGLSYDDENLLNVISQILFRF